MRPVLSPTEASALDAECESRGIGVDSLMENAGRAVAAAAVEVCGGTYGRRAVVVCGKGNNAGDGFVAARQLSRLGMRVTVLTMTGLGSLAGAAAENARRLGGDSSIRVRPYSYDVCTRELARSDIAIDAIFGTGFRGTAEGDFASAIADLNDSDVPVVAADIPSGVLGESGLVDGEAVWAEVTVAFAAAKTGVLLFPGAEYAGVVQVADIGIPDDLIRSQVGLVEESDVSEWLPVREPDTHKKATGVVCIVGGSAAMTGAVCLAARAAYAAGAGLVTLAVPESVLQVAEVAVPEATFLPLPQTSAGSIAASAFEELWKRMGDFDVFAIGPGAGREEGAAEFLRKTACAVPGGFVLDADGLNAFEGRPAELTDRGAGAAILTPHIGEFGRLTGVKAADIEADRVGSARELAKQTQATVLLKGSRTVVADPAGTVRINSTGSSALATAGSGDVLTGTIAALLARGLEPGDAAAAGAYVHGIAGLLAAETLGEGTTALDIAARVAAAIMMVSES